MLKKSAKQKPLMVLSLPCAANFSKVEVIKNLKNKISMLKNMNKNLMKQFMFRNLKGTSGAYQEASSIILQNKYRYNIVLVGWSMGGAAALMLGNHFDGVSGIVTLGASTDGNQFTNIIHKQIPYLQCHNANDEIVPLSRGQQLYDNLKGKQNENHTFEISHVVESNCHQYDDMIDMCTDWIIRRFVKTHLAVERQKKIEKIMVNDHK
jgi:hypothetical protein